MFFFGHFGIGLQRFMIADDPGNLSEAGIGDEAGRGCEDINGA